MAHYRFLMEAVVFAGPTRISLPLFVQLLVSQGVFPQFRQPAQSLCGEREPARQEYDSMAVDNP